MENSKILKQRSELNLYIINQEDTFYDLIEKLNKNFSVIRENQGGRQGIPGIPGLPGCSTPPELLNEDEITSELIPSTEVGGLCLPIDSYNTNSIHDDLQVIYNKFSNKSLLLSNITKVDDNSYVIRKYNEPDNTSAVVSDSNYFYKAMIYNSDEFGYGNHLHLMNSKAVCENSLFGCKSGFSISVDKNYSFNTEYFRTIGQYNEKINNHRHIIEDVCNLYQLKRNETSQTLKIDSGSSEQNDNSGRIQLQKQSADNTFRIPDRTGYIGIWQDTNSSLETWEDILSASININKIKYQKFGTINYSNITEPFSVNDKSIVRFKRLNNWVLIEFHVILNYSEIEVANINNITFNINEPTVGCRTLIWANGCNYKNISQDSEDEDNIEFNRFRINSILLDSDTLFGNKKSFSITCKFNPELSMNELNKEIYLDGQVWATVEESDNLCEPLIIINDDSCEVLKIQ